ncbi:hypothetical protein ASPACDRAFT_53104 [Aspergillus aculeatus ATCC 16872]|uniref:Uncharacterized protein n=1 Tax=Aspergillus aculeatus (strain ATCC 16872 / CBS 172.66 / WB 5094) TaxID=690307 RepID=A0A1L9WS73_ASPA1|nr:uncharacterized protein ASPACDRAFT_53104 [Aspergillus aculeatus ATCC 16872]OJJ98928.1 hypothetical protein ASPACDRAFT_53104 [Aspergillus aculeatus ATCC 16872]
MWASSSSYHSRFAGHTSALDYPAQILSQLVPRPNKYFSSGRYLFDLRRADDVFYCHIPKLLNYLLTATSITILNEILLMLTVVFADGPDLAWFVVNAPGLATGRLILIKFICNEHIRHVLEKNFGKTAESGIEGLPHLDMDLFSIEFLKSIRLSNKFLYPDYGFQDLWVRIIEYNILKYLELKAQERETKFKLNHLLSLIKSARV